tara:strand:- start:952 stop:1092 length:141 start_codon:yes stop_codon:yes gene_type:complete
MFEGAHPLSIKPDEMSKVRYFFEINFKITRFFKIILMIVYLSGKER